MLRVQVRYAEDCSKTHIKTNTRIFWELILYFISYDDMDCIENNNANNSPLPRENLYQVLTW
jgi:hypothetical protein